MHTDDEGVLDVEIDPTNEMAVIASALADASVRSELVTRLRPEHFLVSHHRPIWQAVREIEHRKLACDVATVSRLAKDVDPKHLDLLFGDEPGGNVDFHVDALLWDHQKARAVQGPVKDLVEALRDPRESPERVRAIVRRMSEVFQGGGKAEHLLDSREVARQQLEEIRERARGRRSYPFGIDGLDYYEDSEEGMRRRLIPGAAPGYVTVITACSGGGKSALAANITLGLARQKRRVLYGVWEQNGGMTLEVLACISLGWSRTQLQEGRLTEEEIAAFGKRMRSIGKYVTFFRKPFHLRASKEITNDTNLDMVHEHIAASGCEVFIGDLWERCLVSDRPEDEKRALFRQQAMIEELQVHGILLAQQRLKDIEMRPDKRPTREGIKGSGAWVEVADTILGSNRPALWKKVDDDVMEIFVLKQRYAPWPLGIEMVWDPETAMVSGGRSIEYDRPGEVSEFDAHARAHGQGARVGGKDVHIRRKGR